MPINRVQSERKTEWRLPLESLVRYIRKGVMDDMDQKGERVEFMNVNVDTSALPKEITVITYQQEK